MTDVGIDGWTALRREGLALLVRYESLPLTHATSEADRRLSGRVGHWLAARGIGEVDEIGGVNYLVVNARARDAARLLP